MAHVWKFFRSGGFDQVRLETAEDIEHLHELDQKLWVALSCPVQGLEFDPHTLEIIDGDLDGRVRAPEVINAAQWTCGLLKEPQLLIDGAAALPLAAINDATDEGRRILASAKQVLSDLGKIDASSITVDDTADTAKIMAQTRFNGDGIIPPDAAEEAPVRALIKEIITCMGAETDRSGKPGVNQAKLDAFYKAATSFVGWWEKVEANRDVVLPLGDATPEAAAALGVVKTKIDDYFARCRLAAFDPRALAVLNSKEDDYAELITQDMSADSVETAKLPLSMIAVRKPLPLGDGLNPAWRSAMNTFREKTVKPVFGDQESLTAVDWNALCTKFCAYEEWQKGNTGVAVEQLGLPRIREILAGNGQAVITDLINRDKALEPEFNAISSVDKLTRYVRDLGLLLRNFVNFKDFYNIGCHAIFQVGTLYLDGRSCDLCVRITDVARHSSIAGTSRVFLAYCDCVRKSATEKMTIAAAFTDGDSTFLTVGRNGLFYDRKGRDWDATITKVIEHPISVRQAFWSPYRRVAKMIGDQVEKMASAREKEMEQKAAVGVMQAGTKADPAKPGVAAGAPLPGASTFDIAKFAGIFAAIGLALGAIGALLAGLIGGFMKLSWWQMPLSVIGLILLFSGPSMIMAWLKLRQRNLGPILDANGWAVNTRAMINIPFGNSLTAVGKLPPDAELSLVDPYATKRPRLLLKVLLSILAAVIILTVFIFAAEWKEVVHNWFIR